MPSLSTIAWPRHCTVVVLRLGLHSFGSRPILVHECSIGKKKYHLTENLGSDQPRIIKYVIIAARYQLRCRLNSTTDLAVECPYRCSFQGASDERIRQVLSVSEMAVAQTPDDAGSDRQCRWSSADGQSAAAATSPRQVMSIRPLFVPAVRSFLVVEVVSRHLCYTTVTTSHLRYEMKYE